MRKNQNAVTTQGTNSLIIYHGQNDIGRNRLKSAEYQQRHDDGEQSSEIPFVRQWCGLSGQNDFRSAWAFGASPGESKYAGKAGGYSTKVEVTTDAYFEFRTFPD